jgi:hypothetical protein
MTAPSITLAKSAALYFSGDFGPLAVKSEVPPWVHVLMKIGLFTQYSGQN